MIKAIISIISIFAISWFSFLTKGNKQAMENKDYPTYEAQWKEVIAQENEGKPKSALKLVEKIYAQAKQEKNTPQVYKALMFQSKYTMTLEENSELTIANRFKKEINKADAPTKQLLQSSLAELYWQYYNANRWKFNQRTSTDGGIDESDFRTWDLPRLFEETSKYYELSLQDAKSTQKASIQDFHAILNKDIEAIKYEQLRPSLYDLLIHRAIDFYRNDQSGLTKPAYQFVLKDKAAFGVTKEFLNYQPKTKDSLSNELKTIELYQKLLAFHKKQGNEDAFIQADIERLNFVYEKAKITNKDLLYENALKQLLKKYKHNKTVAMAGYELAELYREKGNQYNSSNRDDKNQWKLKEAIKICDEIIQTYPESLGATNCQALKESILDSSINIITGNDLPTNSPFRTKIEYKNIDQVYFRIAKVNDKDIKSLQKLYREKRVAYLQQLKPLSSWKSTPPNVGDHQRHSYEEMANNKKGLPNGRYVIVASTDQNFSSNNTVGFSVFQVTDLAYYKKELDNGVAIYVKDRTTGKPIPNAVVTLKSDRHSRKYNKTVTADKNGIAQFSIPNKNYYQLETYIKAKGQIAQFGNFYYNNYNEKRKPRWDDHAMVFTDRSIYRPGQTVYFKGISFESDGENSNLNKNKKINVVFQDANGEEIEQLKLTTNEYGSVQGSFVIPRGRMLGRYQINFNDNQYVGISVEEYKRPKFEVKLDTLKGNYKLGDEIKAEGEATAFSGATISNANVKYRVVRNVRYPYWGYYWWRPRPSSPSMEITNGEVTSDEKGRFKIPFTAIADPSVELKDNPEFTYTIYVDVTDINGETRSTSSLVTIGTIAMNLQIESESKLIDAEKNQISIITKNLNGAPLSAKATVAIYKLMAPNAPLTSRLWPAPDQFGLQKEEFKRYFPNEPFNQQEQNKQNWENGKKVLSKTVTTDQETGKAAIAIKTRKWKAGFYRIEVNSKDKFGKEVKQTSIIEIVGCKSKKVADNQFFTIEIDKDSYEPNDVAKIQVGTALNDLEVLIEVVRDAGEILHTETLQLSNEIKTISVPIKENYRGGIVVYYTYIKHNRFFNGEKRIAVPYTNKDLNIEVKTFRDKLQPNQEETWTFTVKGDKAEKVNAEFLASMYDASLDQFQPHRWDYYIPRRYLNSRTPFYSQAFDLRDNLRFENFNRIGFTSYKRPQFHHLNFFGMNLGYSNYRYDLMYESAELDEVVVRGYGGIKKSKRRKVMAPAPMAKAESVSDSLAGQVAGLAVDREEKSLSYSVATVAAPNQPKPTTDNQAPIKARKNLQETAFFLPQLTTDKDGNVSFTFTTPEALTKWRFMAFAHTQDLKTGMYEGSTVTQKELMVTPNAPRFLREGDQLTFSSKISNISNEALSGQAELVLLDATTLQPVYSQFGATSAKQDFTIDAKGNTSIDWNLTIPEDVPAVTYRVLAKAGNFTDGEENALPILSNRKLVTESMPVALRSNQTKTFTFDKLITNNSSTLKNHKLTFEMTSNPAWYAVQSLPYLMEYPYECSEQIFSRYYANSLATHIANSNPKIQSVFNTWRDYQPDALKSNLEKNEELKSLILRETPWVREAKSEAEQKRRIALLFDLNKMASEQAIALNTLRERQLGNGGWSWFPGGRANQYISQHMVAGFGHLDRLGVKDVREDKKTWRMTEKAVRFLDDELRENFEDLKRYNKDWKSTNTISQLHVHYFYTRSFFNDVPVAKRNKEAFDFYFNLLKKDWLSDHLYKSGLSALALHRYGEKELAQKIMTSLDERSITSEELGMYWKNNTAGYFWHQAPIETQALMIEAFDEVENNQKAVDELKVWLLKNKQTNSWKTTKATAEAVYSLLLRGGDWLAIDDVVEVTIGNKELDFKNIDGVQAEAGTGYVKTSWNGKEIQPEMGKFTATKKGEGIAWGAMYWQYFEDLDKITTHKTPLQLKKQLFLQQNSDKGPKITPIKEGDTVNVGDLLKVRIELRVDRDMEFVHMKDMRAAGFEPTNVLSQYKWQDGLGYYESTKDASTDFFFDYLPKGVYVFEYPLRVNNAGDFSNGITTIQCMYAPEFTSHSEGVRVKVAKK